MKMRTIYLEQSTLKSILRPKAFYNYLHSPYTICKVLPFFKGDPVLYEIHGFGDGSVLHFLTQEELNSWFTNLRKV